jgi:hypothetical protein
MRSPEERGDIERRSPSGETDPPQIDINSSEV